MQSPHRFGQTHFLHFFIVPDRPTVTATASTTEKLDWLLSLPSGATHVANYKTQDFSEVVKKVTDNKGVDVIIDFVGQSHWGRNIESLAIDGRMTLLALLSGKLFPYTPISRFIHLTVRFRNSSLRSQANSFQAASNSGINASLTFCPVSSGLDRAVCSYSVSPLPTISKTGHLYEIPARGPGSHHRSRRNRSDQSLHLQSMPHSGARTTPLSDYL